MTRCDHVSSLLLPLDHRLHRQIEVECRPLADLEDSRFNMLVLDVQGAERDALRSGTFRDVDLLICEASWNPRYAAAVDRGQLEAYLEERGGRRQHAFQQPPTGIAADSAANAAGSVFRTDIPQSLQEPR